MVEESGFPGLGEEEEGFGLGGSCCLLFFVMGWDCHGGWGKARREKRRIRCSPSASGFFSPFLGGFSLGVSDRRQVQTDSSSDQISTGSVTD